MSVEFFWQLPANADARYGDARLRKRGERLKDDPPPFTDGVTDPRGKRFNFFDYVEQIARAADLSGFDGVQIQHDVAGDESWIIAGYIARSTRHVKLLTEFEASRGSAVYAAKNAISFQRYTHGRFAWQITRGGDETARKRLGDTVASENVALRIDEFLTVARGVITEPSVTFKGEFFEVLEGGFKGPLAGHAVPQIYLNGSDEANLKLSARQADVHVFDAETVQSVTAQISQLNNLANDQQRTVAAGLRIDVLARETEEEALLDANRFHAQRERPNTLADTRIEGVLYQGFDSEQTGATAALIGSYQQVIEQLLTYVDAGISHFILAASPHLEEAYRVGEYLLPELREQLAARNTAAA